MGPKFHVFSIHHVFYPCMFSQYTKQFMLSVQTEDSVSVLSLAVGYLQTQQKGSAEETIPRNTVGTGTVPVPSLAAACFLWPLPDSSGKRGSSYPSRTTPQLPALQVENISQELLTEPT